MSDKMKRALAALAAFGALALGGAAIAGATTGGSSDQATAENEQSDGAEANETAEAPDQPGDTEDGPGEQADGSESGENGNAAENQGGDGDGELPAAAERKARAAAEQATGGKATGDVEPAEQADPVEDANDQPTPKGAAYEVEIAKGDQALKVFLNSSFDVIDTQRDAG
jgi:hypothetical protein